jgi:hypothetical protein
MRHPDLASLALLAGGELSAWARWRIGRHVRACPQCQQEVAGFRRRREWFREAAAELPAGLNWSRLAAEMKANIQLGLEAGECVGGPVRRRAWLTWRTAAALASIAVVIAGGWWLHLPHSRIQPAGDVVIEATAEGIELKEPQGALTLFHSAAAPVVVSASAEGAITARFVDDETGLVTVNNVFVE